LAATDASRILARFISTLKQKPSSEQVNRVGAAYSQLPNSRAVLQGRLQEKRSQQTEKAPYFIARQLEYSKTIELA